MTHFILGVVLGFCLGVLLMRKFGTMIVTAINNLEATLKSAIQRIEAAIQKVESAIKAAKGVVGVLLLALFLGAAARPAHAQILHATLIAAHSDRDWMLTGAISDPVAAAMFSGLGASTNPYTVTLTWTNGSGCGVTVNGSTSTCFANVYACQGTCSSAATGTWAKIGSTANGASTFTDTTPAAGGSDSYYVTDVATGAGWNGQESGPSNVSVVTFPVPAPTVTSASHN